MKYITCLHSFIFDTDTFASAVANHEAIEIDISLDDNGNPYIGHPLSWYIFHHKSFKEPIRLDTALEMLKHTPNTKVVFDIKQKQAVDSVMSIVNEIGAERCFIHAFASELVLDPEETKKEPQRKHENIPTHTLQRLKAELNVPIIVSARGIDSAADLESRRLWKTLANMRNVIDFFNPGITDSPYDVSELQKKLQAYEIGQTINIDEQQPPKTGKVFCFTNKKI